MTVWWWLHINMAISIFAKRAFLNTKPNQSFEYSGTKPSRGYLKRVSSIIRGDQVAEAISAKLNPESGYEKDICIYVKPVVDERGNFKYSGRKSFLDVLDGWAYADFLNRHPEVNAIVCSERDYINLASVINNQVMLIPQHHCNFERKKRTREEIKVVGIIGNHKAFSLLPPELKTKLKEHGIELFTFSEFFTRQDIVDFYEKIDIQIVWRPYRKRLANPVKIVNAASFGIPTIALDEIYFREMGNCYIGVNNLDELLHEIDQLVENRHYYEAYANLCLKKSEHYHISKIAKLYKDLGKL